MWQFSHPIPFLMRLPALPQMQLMRGQVPSYPSMMSQPGMGEFGQPGGGYPMGYPYPGGAPGGPVSTVHCTLTPDLAAIRQTLLCSVQVCSCCPCSSHPRATLAWALRAQAALVLRTAVVPALAVAAVVAVSLSSLVAVAWLVAAVLLAVAVVVALPW